MIEVKDMPTHRTTTEVDRRLFQYAWTRHKVGSFDGLTFNDVLDELLKEVGF